MRYDLPFQTEQADWPEGAGSIPATTPGGQPRNIPVLDTNHLILGQIGCGKTELTKRVVRELLKDDPKKLAVFFQIKPDDFTGPFLREGDKVISYGMTKYFPPQALFLWNQVREIRQSDDAEATMKQIAESLFSEQLADNRNIVWASAAMETYIAFLRVLVYTYNNNPSNALVIRDLSAMPVVKLMEQLARCDENYGLLRRVYSYDPNRPSDFKKLPRRGEDTLFFLQSILNKFGGSFLSEDGTDTIHDFLYGTLGSRLFIQHDMAKAAASRPFVLFFLRKLIEEKLSPSADVPAPLLLVLDEIDKISGDIGSTGSFGLCDGVNLGRGYNLKVILSTQSLENLYAIAPELNREHNTHALIGAFPVIASFRTGDAQTLTALQTLFGTRRRNDVVLPPSRYGAPVLNIQIEPIVSIEELTSLKTGEIYIKILEYPPKWCKIVK